MSVLIKSMEMPTCCEECAFVRTVGLDRWKCELSGCDFNSWDVGWGDGEENKYIRHSSCPLVEVQPHGRLIDADEFLKRAIGTKCFRGDYALMLEELVGESTTIIPAEEE